MRVNPFRPGGLMGVTQAENLEYLHDPLASRGLTFSKLRLLTSEDEKSVTIQGCGEAIILTKDGWFLEDTSGG